MCLNNLGFPKARPSTRARRSFRSGAPVLTDDRAAMTAPLLISVAFAAVTTAAATLWAVLVANGMNGLPETRPTERRDIRTW